MVVVSLVMWEPGPTPDLLDPGWRCVVPLSLEEPGGLTGLTELLSKG